MRLPNSLMWLVFLVFSVLESSLGMQNMCFMPPTFGSFNGRPARVLNDCVWDFAQCTQSSNGLKCCQDRFNQCCLFIMGRLPENNNAITTSPAQASTTTTEATTTAPYRHADTMIGCVWQFNGCVQQKVNNRDSDESICYERYEECKMIMMGMPVDELPVPFMSSELTTTTTAAPNKSQQRKRPTLINCLWGYFGCKSNGCELDWNTCMEEAMQQP